MRPFVRAPLLVGLLALLGGPAFSAVELQFGDLAKFSDFGETVRERERNEAVLRAHIQALAQRLPSGQSLSIEIKDVNLAGEMEPVGGRYMERLRVLRQVSMPRIDLEFRLSQGGQVIRQGASTLRNMSYLDGRLPSQLKGEALQHERFLLDEWFEKDVLKP
ncbi:hypothetical protein HNQ51_003759 [Inhella inkyongensis]|uniref:DUF3016 domain-containing protein n=1 Tax=Inhella inkyongensis TaxID=392593 RepID=A0A840S9V4_9BURK|nr:DUF3016 domain-containing protein [Inhella inkyongensis]MBB5206413.1 hypothetical protein [Inhella inkyongensis]